MAIDLELTHAELGRLVGARRPTVTLALQALREQGDLDRAPDGEWLLADRSRDALSV
jgi:DNA-binding IclR family transcriptional regulator